MLRTFSHGNIHERALYMLPPGDRVFLFTLSRLLLAVKNMSHPGGTVTKDIPLPAPSSWKSPRNHRLQH